MATIRIPVTELRIGDVILTPKGNQDIRVDKIHPFACSSRDWHVNGSLCYSRSSEVIVRRDEATE